MAQALPAVWEVVTPAAAIAARLDAVDAALVRGLGDAVKSPEVTQAAQLARAAAESAAAHAAGRPLFAAHAALDWPSEPHLVLWHAITVLREFRGDGHVAALLLAELSGLQSMVLHTASGQANGGFLRASRGWSREQWAAAADGLRERGLLDGEQLSERGQQLRVRLEQDTDRLAAPAYAVLGTDGCARLAELARPLSRTLVKAGFLAAVAPPRRDPDPSR